MLYRAVDILKMDFLNLLFGVGLVTFGLFIISSSYVRQILNFRNRNRADAGWSSPAPFVGPIFTLVGLTLLDVDLPTWSWLIFVFDPDTVIVVYGFPFFLWKQSSRSWGNCFYPINLRN